jgi:glycosyltransferase involved in cell wall biosynthesis
MFSFSILIPIYNGLKQGEAILKRCFDSVINQKYDKTKIEIIIINDGSIDNTLQFIEKYNKTSTIPLKVISRENKGIADTRIELIQNASNDYIVFLECDDELAPDTLLNYNVSLEKYPADCVHGNSYDVDGNGKMKKRNTFFNSLFNKIFKPADYDGELFRKDRENIKWRFNNCYWGKCYSTKFLKSLDYSGLINNGKYTYDDFIFILYVALFVTSINEIKAFTYIYY